LNPLGWILLLQAKLIIVISGFVAAPAWITADSVLCDNPVPSQALQIIRMGETSWEYAAAAWTCLLETTTTYIQVVIL